VEDVQNRHSLWGHAQSLRAQLRGVFEGAGH
jgi:hypothetical protein